MENKEAEICLEEAKADAAIKVMKAKQVEMEVLRLSLGSCPMLMWLLEDILQYLYLHPVASSATLLFVFMSLFSCSLCYNPSVVLHDAEPTAPST